MTLQFTVDERNLQHTAEVSHIDVVLSNGEEATLSAGFSGSWSFGGEYKWHRPMLNGKFMDMNLSDVSDLKIKAIHLTSCEEDDVNNASDFRIHDIVFEATLKSEVFEHGNITVRSCRIADPEPGSYQVIFPELKEWLIPVTWKQVSLVPVKAPSIGDAERVLWDRLEDFDEETGSTMRRPPAPGEYIPDTLRIGDPTGHPDFWLYKQKAIQELYNSKKERDEDGNL